MLSTSRRQSWYWSYIPILPNNSLVRNIMISSSVLTWEWPKPPIWRWRPECRRSASWNGMWKRGGESIRLKLSSGSATSRGLAFTIMKASTYITGEKENKEPEAETCNYDRFEMCHKGSNGIKHKWSHCIGSKPTPWTNISFYFYQVDEHFLIRNLISKPIDKNYTGAKENMLLWYCQ